MGVVFAGTGWFPGTLVYTYEMAPLVAGEVSILLQSHGIFGSGHKVEFVGQEDVCEALNRCEDILACISSLLRSKIKTGKVILKSPASATVAPNTTGSTFKLITLPTFSPLLGKANFLAKEFVDLAEAMEFEIAAMTGLPTS